MPEAVVKIHFELQAFVTLGTVGKINIVKGEVRILEDDGAPLVVEAFIGETGEDAFGLAFVIDCRAAVALALGRVEEDVVAFDVFKGVGELIRLGFQLLNAEDIRLLALQPVDKAFFFGGTNAVDVPRIEFHCVTFAFVVRAIIKEGQSLVKRLNLWIFLQASAILKPIKARHRTRWAHQK